MIELKIGERIINDMSDCYVIAEIGHNHQGDLKKALEMIRRAHEVGCDAVKMQKRNNKSLFTKELYNSPYENENSFGRTYGEHREALEFGRIEYTEMAQYANSLGITFFATPFDRDSADFLQFIGVPCFKTASGDLTNIPLLRHIAEFNKPMFISTGGATLDMVRKAYEAVLELNPQICLLQCTASYPVLDFSELNLNVINTYKRHFDCVVGLSAHDAGIAMAVVAYTLGARVIEKHFTLSRVMKGTDHAFSLEPKGMERMIRDLKRARIAIGDGQKRIYPSELKPIKKMGKGCYAAVDLAKGVKLLPSHIAIKSPMADFLPYDAVKLIGRELQADVKQDEPFTVGAIKNG